AAGRWRRSDPTHHPGQGGPPVERLRWPLTAAAVALSLGSGCIHVHVDPDGKVKSVTPSMSETDPAGSEDRTTARKVDPAVKRASATLPIPSIAVPKFPVPGKSSGPRIPATDIAVIWQNKLGYLPDPSKGGATGAGVVGQLFLFGQGPKGLTFAPADGTLT